MARIDKFRRDYLSRTGGAKMHLCPVCGFRRKAFPTRHAVIGHLVIDHNFGRDLAIQMVGRK